MPVTDLAIPSISLLMLTLSKTSRLYKLSLGADFRAKVIYESRV